VRYVTIIVSVLFLLAVTSACGDGGVQPGTGITGGAEYAGAPASGAEINVYDVPERSGVPAVGTTAADGDGRFTVALAPGTYYVVARLNRSGAPPYLSKLPPDPVVVTDGFADAGVLTLAQESGEEPPPPDTGISGSVMTEGGPVAGAVVYLYARPDEGLKGPTHVAFGRSGMDGTFRLDVAPGTYYVAVRKRFDASSSGELRAGDLSGEYDKNPVTVGEGKYTNIGAIVITEIDTAKLARLEVGIPEDRGDAGISGVVTDADGRPLHGVHVFAYTDYKMMGKPQYKSSSTGEDGAYTLSFDKPGKYYIGARDSVGGPMEPGDMVGVYEGTDDNSVELTDGVRLEDIDITLREVQ